MKLLAFKIKGHSDFTQKLLNKVLINDTIMNNLRQIVLHDKFYAEKITEVKLNFYDHYMG